MNAELISIGDEILIGQIVNTNSVWIAQQLNMSGIRVSHMCTVSDEREAISDALAQAEKRAGLIIITGGLGPTRDDLTKQVLADYFEVPLVLDQEVLGDVEAHFAKRGRKLNELNRAQALVPRGCTPVRNRNGTAPGMWMQRNGVHFFSLPGVPSEMKPMVSDFILPEIIKSHKLPAIMHRTVLTIGIGESDLAMLISGWEDNLSAMGLKLAYLPQQGQVRLRISGSGETRDEISAIIDAETEKLKALAGRYIYGYEQYGEESPGIVRILCELLHAKGKTVSLAESCTGGYLSSLITAIPGASRFFKGAIVPYTNTAKHFLLDVDRTIFETKGAVSEECVTALAQNVRDRFGTDYSIAISGIAGPTGGTPEKPVGTVWIAAASPNTLIARKFRFGDNRAQNITMAAHSAADLLRKLILNER